VFEIFDEDGSGDIDTKELRKAMKALGLRYSKREIEDMIDEVDDDNSGLIEYEEFLKLMTKKISEDKPMD
jgi:centrin-1